MTGPHPIAVWLKATGKTQAALAADVGCKRWMINRIVSGYRSPSTHLLRRISSETGISADDLLAWRPAQEAA
jgi:transcriptional regulator with XRE-family HTH domain